VATDKLKKRHFIAFVAFLSLFLGTDKNYKSQFEKRQPVAFLSPFLSVFFAFFSNFLWFSDLKIFLFGRNPSTFVRLRLFLPDVTQLTHQQHDGIMPIISFLVFVYFKVQKKLLFLFQKPTKNRQKKRQKSDKTPTNTLIKTGNSKKATVVVIFFGLSVPPQLSDRFAIDSLG